jgi:hypothetical protein
LGPFGTTDIRPSCASIIERQIDNPISIPPDFVVKGGLNIRLRSCGLIPPPVSATDTITSLFSAAELPTAHAVASMRHEYELLRDLDLAGIVQVLELAHTNEGLTLSRR